MAIPILLLAALADWLVTACALKAGKVEANPLYRLAPKLGMSTLQMVWVAHVVGVVVTIAAAEIYAYGWWLYGPVAGIWFAAAVYNARKMHTS